MNDLDDPQTMTIHKAPEGLALKGLDPKTARDYQRDWNWLLAYSGARNADELGEEWFLAFAWFLSEHDYSVGRLEHFWAALAHFQQDLIPRAVNRWSQDSGARRRFTGVLKNCKDPTVVGAITIERLRVLLSYTPEIPLRNVFLISYAGLLRWEDVETLQCWNVNIADNDKDVIIEITAGKGHKPGGSKRPQHFYVRAVGLAAIPSIRALMKTRRGALLFNDVTHQEVNARIHQVAVSENWDPKVRWSHHSLRHGADADLKREGKSLMDRMVRGRWRSARVEAHYGSGA